MEIEAEMTRFALCHTWHQGKEGNRISCQHSSPNCMASPRSCNELAKACCWPRCSRQPMRKMGARGWF